jgi:hypothetical protein
VQLAQKIHDGIAVLRVEVPGGLVGKENDRIANQRAGYGDTLLLTSGKLRGVVLGALGHGDTFESGLNFLLALGGAHAAIGEWKLDVFVDSQIANEIE